MKRYDPTIYLGSAAHYRYGRPAYSPQLEAVLTDEADLDGRGTLALIVHTVAGWTGPARSSSPPC